MKTNLFLTIALFSFCFFANSQTGNEVLGQSVISFDQQGMQQTYTTGGSLTTGDFNTLIGDGAGSSLNSGSRNVMVGTMAGASATNDGENVFIGHEAGKFTTTFDNTFVGSEAGEQNNTGTDNTFIGEESGTNNDSGSNNTFVGEDSGFNNTTGTSNTFIGSTSGRSNTIGNGNTFVGGETGEQTNVDNFFGNTNQYDLDLTTSRGSGFANTSGIANSFLGGGSGHSNLDGNANTFLGYNAGARNEAGDLNTFVGYGAGWNNDTSQTTLVGGDRNTYLGAIAGSLNRSGNDNVGLGHDANFALTSGANRNVFIGNSTRVRGTDNLILGYNARTSTSADRNRQIVLGANSQTFQTNAAIVGNNVSNNVANTLLLGGNTTSNRYSVAVGTTTANTNASLTLGDTDKGLLINRVTTTQRNEMINSPASGSPLAEADSGLMVYDTTEKALFVWDGTEWGEIGGASQEAGSSSIPELLNYKAIIKDDDGDVLASAPLSIQFTIYEGAALTNNVYQESHTTNTDDKGLVIVNIGGGTTGDDFSSINWGNDEHYLNVQVNIGFGLVDMGTAPFVSVPYALRAKYAENLDSEESTRSLESAKRIEALEKEVKELKEMISKLIKPKR